MDNEEIIPTIEELKNPNAVENNISTDPEETHLDYKKRLNKKVSEFTDEEK